jgi:hypothetical protein
MRCSLYVSLMFCFVASASARSQTMAHSGVNTSIYAILKYDAVIDMAMNTKFYRPKPTTLSSSEVDKMENLVDSCYRAFYKEHPTLRMIEPLSKYRRQYVAVINGKGQKEVWINFFYSPSIKNWKQRVVVVDDGGTYFFQLQINLSLKKAYGLIPNGVA